MLIKNISTVEQVLIIAEIGNIMKAVPMQLNRLRRAYLHHFINHAHPLKG